jgi:hypothetical protein
LVGFRIQGYTLTGKGSKSNRDCYFWSSKVERNGGHVERLPKRSLISSSESDTKGGGKSLIRGNMSGGA